MNGWNADFLEAEYLRFREDPGSVPADLQAFFRGFDLALNGAAPGGVAALPAGGAADSGIQSAVEDLIHAYRSNGHLAAKLDPFGRERARPETLSLSYHGLSETELDTVTTTSGGAGTASLIWTGPSQNRVTRYVIRYGTNSSGPLPFESDVWGTMSATITGLSRFTTWYFEVFASDGWSEGPASSPRTSIFVS